MISQNIDFRMLSMESRLGRKLDRKIERDALSIFDFFAGGGDDFGGEEVHRSELITFPPNFPSARKVVDD